MSDEVWELEVDPFFDGKRVDQFLAKKLPEMSRSYIQKLVDEGAATSEGETLRRSARLNAYDTVEFVVPESKPYEVTAEDIPLDISYQDADLLLVDKAKGMIVHPTTNAPGGTLVNALLHHVTDLSGINGVERPGIVHRIDKDTTGLLVVCKNDVAHHRLADQFRDHSLDRLYVSLVYGGAPMPRAGTITSMLGRDARDRRRQASRKDGSGKEAVTHYTVVEDYGPIAMVECVLDTGRTHQIRVHMAEQGHPLVGDPVYGGTKSKWFPRQPELRGLVAELRGQMLHAAVLGFIHPRTDEYVRFRCPPHDEMMTVIRGLRTFAGMDPDAPGPWDREAT